MLPLSRRSKVGLISGFVICASLLTTSVVLSSRALSSVSTQVKEKVVEKDPPIFNEPIKLDSVKAVKKLTKFGESFEADKDWLKGAEIKLKNISGKEITFVEVDVNFPDTMSTGPEMSFRINLGRMHGMNMPGKETLSLLPDADLNVVIDEKRYADLVRFVKSRHSIDEINKTHVRIGFVVFADGTAWGAGSFYKQDPNNSKRWLPVDSPQAQ